MAVFTGPSHPQQSPLSQQSHQAAESKDWQANRPPHPHIKFSNQPNAAKRPRKPVHWVLPGEVQASPSDQPKQVNGAGRQAAAVHDPWLLGEEPTHRQPVTGRKRLSWAQPSPPSNAPTNSRTAVQAKWQPRPQASRPPNGSQLSTAQSKNDDMRPGHANMQPWKSLQPPAQSRRSGQVSPEVAAERARRQAQAVPPSREQYLRNQAQMQKQIALHELKKRMQEQEQGQGVAAASPYTELRADLKRKPAPVAQAVPQVPAEVVIPPDVTVQQLAQLLGGSACSAWYFRGFFCFFFLFLLSDLLAMSSTVLPRHVSAISHCLGLQVCKPHKSLRGCWQMLAIPLALLKTGELVCPVLPCKCSAPPAASCVPTAFYTMGSIYLILASHALPTAASNCYLDGCQHSFVPTGCQWIVQSLQLWSLGVWLSFLRKLRVRLAYHKQCADHSCCTLLQGVVPGKSNCQLGNAFLVSVRFCVCRGGCRCSAQASCGDRHGACGPRQGVFSPLPVAVACCHPLISFIHQLCLYCFI